MEELYKQLAALARQHGARRLVLFGSRARGDNRYNSDVDLAVYGMPEGNRAISLRRSGGRSARLRRLSGFIILPPFKEGTQVAPCAQRVTSLTVVHSLFKGCSV